MAFFILYGYTTVPRELGVVAEKCPHCGQVASCLVTGQVRRVHIYFIITLMEEVIQRECQCRACGAWFPCEQWRHPEIVPAGEADAVPLETLIERTNPSLPERLLWAQQQERFATDREFATANEAMERLRPGQLRTQLQDELRRWEQLSEEQRGELLNTATELARAVQFAESVASRLPGPAGCLASCLVCLAVWSAFFWTTTGRYLLSSVALVLGGFAGAAVVLQTLYNRRVRGWAREVLIPEGKMAGIDFDRLVALLQDPPGPGPRVREDLDRLKLNAPILIKELVAGGKVGRDNPS